MNEAVELCCELISRPSVTPADAGCQELLAQRLQAIGFHCEHLRCGEVDNLWAERGGEGPLFVFAGHTDVVPTGPEQDWQSPPFQPTITDDVLVGRGAADMKASLAAMVVACERFVSAHPEHGGRIGFLLTSDEEGPAVDGTVKVMQWLEQQGKAIDWCLVGEPSSENVLGDTIKNGRRGSLGGYLTVRGIQGHIAYPQLASNPIHLALPALAELTEQHWDSGNEFFQPTSLQISNINGGTGASNVIPGELQVMFNFRFSTELSAGQLRERTEAILDKHELDYSLDWNLSGEPFVTGAGALVEAALGSIQECLGRDSKLSTSGGTSDARFIAPSGAEVLELGPVNASIHKLNEEVSCAAVEDLTRVYQRITEKLLLDGA
ncbi:MAG: succinyl-diaminopimelate desuccinylase [Halieaceae bacterium]